MVLSRKKFSTGIAIMKGKCATQLFSRTLNYISTIRSNLRFNNDLNYLCFFLITQNDLEIITQTPLLVLYQPLQ